MLSLPDSQTDTLSIPFLCPPLKKLISLKNIKVLKARIYISGSKMEKLKIGPTMSRNRRAAFLRSTDAVEIQLS
jgi:hypothetical protein